MPLSFIPAAATRIGSASKKAGETLKGGVKKMKGRGEKPKALGPEGIMMLSIAGVLEGANIILFFLDFAFGAGIFLSPIINFAGTVLIGTWLWLRFGKLPLKKALLPLLINSIPIVKLFPFWWFFSVATSLDWKSTPSSQAEQEQKSEKVA